MNARVGPALLPVIQIRLSLFQALEALTLQWRFLRMADSGFDLTFSVRISHAARQSDRAVMLQHVAVERIKRGIVNIGRGHAFAEIIQHHNTSHTTQSAKRLLVQFGPDSRAGAEYQESNRLSAMAQSHHEQPRAPVLAALRIAHHGAGAIVYLRLLARSGF